MCLEYVFLIDIYDFIGNSHIYSRQVYLLL